MGEKTKKKTVQQGLTVYSSLHASEITNRYVLDERAFHFALSSGRGIVFRYCSFRFLKIFLDREGYESGNIPEHERILIYRVL